MSTFVVLAKTPRHACAYWSHNCANANGNDRESEGFCLRQLGRETGRLPIKTRPSLPRSEPTSAHELHCGSG
jgi:hypothetical protein